MFLGFVTIVIMAAVAYAYLNEDLPTAFTMFCNVLLAGLVAFNYFEPLATVLEEQLENSPMLADYADAFSLILLFCPTLGVLRLIVNNLAPSLIEFPALVQRVGAMLFGALTGYLAAGFLVCVFQTLPLPLQFMSFKAEAGSPRFLHVLPGDRVWLALMHRAGDYALNNGGSSQEGETFDKYGSFELRYANYRRFGDGERLKYRGEFDPARRPQAETAP